jgi:aminoglycoside phosphotransferase (APT) family kinase protein
MITLSRESVITLSDLIENRLSMMHVGDRDDLREMVALRKALAELHGIDAVAAGILKSHDSIPRRGRRRKVTEMIGEHIDTTTVGEHV